jgi:Dolichyl-phosphate-mannose-protein mannosyltransferase
MTTADVPTEQTSLVLDGAELLPRRDLSDRLPRPWLFPLAVFGAAWLLIVAAWLGGDAVAGQSHPWSWHILIMDTGFYRGIAQYGYAGDPAKAAFFPVFPLLIHVVSYVTGGDYLLAGLITMVACGAASAVAVWALADRLCGRRIADRAVILYCVFPGAMTFSILYSEPLAVALSAAALLALVDRRWLLAGIIGAVATAERPTLVVLAAVAGVAAVQAIWTRREWRALLAPALTPVGILLFFDFLGHRYHDYGYWFKVVNQGWGQHFDGGVSTLRLLLWLNPHDPSHKAFVAMLTIMFVAGLVGLALLVAARLPLPVTLFGVLIMALAYLTANAGPRPRLVWLAFPIFIGAAAKLPRVIYWPVVVLSAAGLVVLVGAWRQLFGPNLAP